MKRFYLPLVCLLVVNAALNAQADRCYTDEMVRSLRGTNPAYDAEMAAWQANVRQMAMQTPQAAGSRGQLYTIPIVFHIILQSQSQINAVKNQLNAQLATLNRDFRKQNSDTSTIRTAFKPLASDVEIEFCFAVRDPSGNGAVGYTETITTHAAWDPDTEGDDMKSAANGGHNAWNTNKYVNVWVVDIAGSQFGGTAGYAYIGSSGVHGSSVDGIVLDYSLGFGSTNRSLTHEMGHYFGLYHTWGASGGCSDDDGISDTPESFTANYGCDYSENSCNTGAGDLPDMIENYMDYSDCPAMYTVMQKNVMRTVLAGIRASLTTNNPGCQGVNVAPVADFSAPSTTVCQGSSVSFVDNSLNLPTSWSWTFQGGSPGTSTQQNPTITYNTAGTFNVTLTATNPVGSDSETKTGYITVLNGSIGTVLSQDFEGAFPGSWSISNPDGGLTWESVSVSGSSPGTKAARVNIFNYQTVGMRDGLISPVIDLTGKSQLSLTFNYAHRRFSANEHDSLIVYVSTNGGTTYPNRVYANAEDNAAGANFATGNLITTDFVPSSSADWCAASATGVACPVINLDAFSGQSNVRLKFEIYNDYGNNIYVDNISLTGCIANSNAPVANFTANQTSGCGTVAVNFTDQSTNNPATWSWQFTGGTPSTSPVQNPSVAYSSAGTYNVSLTVANASGSDSETKSGYITVYSNPSTAASTFNPSCPGVNNGSIDLTVIGGFSPFTYAWSNGAATQDLSNLTAGTFEVTVTDNHSCSVTRSVTLIAGAALQLSANVTDDTGGAGVGGITLTVSNGTLPYLASWSNGGTGLTLSGLTAGAYSVTVTDGSGCQATGAYTVNNAGVAPVADFSASQNSGCAGFTVNFTDLSANAPTSWNWQFPGGIQPSSVQPNPSVTYSNPGTYNVTLTAANATGNDSKTVNGYITVFSNPVITVDNVQHDGGGCTGSINISVSGGKAPYGFMWSTSQTTEDLVNGCDGTHSVTVTDDNGCTATASATIAAGVAISGLVNTEMNIPVPSVTVNLTGQSSQSQVTTTTGLFGFNVSSGGSYTVTPSKANDIKKDNGVTTLDILLMQRHILLVQELSTPYKIIAADVNGSGSVTNADIVMMRSLILYNISTFSNGRLWTFASSDFAFPDIKNPFPFTGYRSYANAGGSYANQNFIGMKLGDVNNSWDAGVPKTHGAGEVQFMMDNYNVLPGEEITVPVKVKDFANMTGYQFTLSWDPEVLSLLQITNRALDGYYGENQLGEGLLATLWYSETTDAITLNEDAVAFELKFKVVGQKGAATDIEISSALAGSESYNGNFDMLGITPQNGKVTVGDAVSILSVGNKGWNYAIHPNPVADVLNVSVNMQGKQDLKLMLYNSIGQKLEVESFLNVSEANVRFGMKNHEPGIYFIRIEAGAKTVTSRVIKID